MINVFGNGNVARITCRILDEEGMEYRWYGTARKERPMHQAAPPVLRLGVSTPLAKYIQTKDVLVDKYILCHNKISFTADEYTAALYRAKCGNNSQSASLSGCGKKMARKVIVDDLQPHSDFHPVDVIYDWLHAIRNKDDITLWCEPLPTLIANYSRDVTDADRVCKSVPISYTTYRVAGCTRYETLYTPDASLIPYRSTLSGEILTIERSYDRDMESIAADEDYISKVMGCEHVQRICDNKMLIGKIVDSPLSDATAAEFRRKGFHLIGRMANWQSKYMLDDIPSSVLNALQNAR